MGKYFNIKFIYAWNEIYAFLTKACECKLYRNVTQANQYLTYL